MSIFPTKVFLATDGSREAELAARTAADLATSTDSELHVLTVAPGLPDAAYHIHEAGLRYETYEQALEAVKGEAQRVLDEQVQKLQEAGGTVIEAHLMIGKRRDQAIVHLAEELGAGLLVLGSRGLGRVRRGLMGSVSDSVVRHAHCPVVVVRGEPVSFPIKILLATDGSKEAELATTTTADLASSTGSELHVVSVFPASAYVHPYYEDHFPEAAETLRREARVERQEMLDKQVDRVQEAGGNVAQTHIRTGETAEEIVTLAEEIGAGLIVMGSKGLGGIKRALIGSVSAAVVSLAHCPVLVVRPEKQGAE